MKFKKFVYENHHGLQKDLCEKTYFCFTSFEKLCHVSMNRLKTNAIRPLSENL